ncbi:MAG TPA: metalloregulator ArsR/SmtB family transcription factor [Armatimonadota bacterium]|nr:metalloregulator ArsR/SmtB family transcription factor [Armatimonadota bacterium]
MTHIPIELTIQIHQALADVTRIRIVRLLLERELCVCEIEDALAEPQYKVSRHLAVLKNAGVVRDWREGQWMHYEISPNLPPTWRTTLEALRSVWDESADVEQAVRQLHQHTTRPPGGSTLCSG